MSRLLNSLKEAEKARKNDVNEPAVNQPDHSPIRRREPGYFWMSMFLLLLTCGSIIAGYYLLRDLLLAPGP